MDCSHMSTPWAQLSGELLTSMYQVRLSHISRVVLVEFITSSLFFPDILVQNHCTYPRLIGSLIPDMWQVSPSGLPS